MFHWCCKHSEGFLRRITNSVDIESAWLSDGFALVADNDVPVSHGRIEVGHIFKLGTRYTDILNAGYPDQDGNQKTIEMGCYGIGVGRLMAAAIEQHHDDNGIIFPMPIAPFQALITSLNADNPDVKKASESIYSELQQSGIEVLFDDRDAAAGVKFNDADLLGLPVRIVISPRNIRQEAAEIKLRSQSEAEMVPLEDVVARVKELVSSES